MIDPFTNKAIDPYPNKPPLVRMGGKRYLAKRIVEKIDALDYSLYIEPFFGGGRIYFEKRPHFAEIINDIEVRIFNFFSCCQKWAEEMEYLQSTSLVKDENRFFYLYNSYHNPAALAKIKEKIDLAWKVIADHPTDQAKQILLQEAINFFFYSNMAFRGSLTARTMTYFENDPRTENNRMRWRIFRPLAWMGTRMRRTQVMNQDFSRIFKLSLHYSNHTRIFYLDPPYWGTEGYEVEFPFLKYLELAFWLNSLDETDYFILSINDHPWIRAIFSNFKIEEVPTHYTTGGAGQKKDVIELLITPTWSPKYKKYTEMTQKTAQTRLSTFLFSKEAPNTG